ncbi:hypothetical protein ABIA41_001273 [Bradyrhizobium sp. USDA 313]
MKRAEGEKDARLWRGQAGLQWCQAEAEGLSA